MVVTMKRNGFTSYRHLARTIDRSPWEAIKTQFIDLIKTVAMLEHKTLGTKHKAFGTGRIRMQTSAKLC